MSEHASGYMVDAALALARDLKHGPLPPASAPTPTAHEAIEIVNSARRTCGFNWITGEVAECVLRAYEAGVSTKRGAANPYPDWSDEHRAWRQGKASRE